MKNNEGNDRIKKYKNEIIYYFVFVFQNPVSTSLDPCQKSWFDDLYNLLNDDTDTLHDRSNCTNANGWIRHGSSETLPLLEAGRKFYAYFTPVILLIGFVGNSLSLNVFISKNMRSLSASTYLAALSTSDLLTLVFFVTIDWLRRGLVYLYPEIKMQFINLTGK